MKKIFLTLLAVAFVMGAPQKAQAAGASDIISYLVGKASEFKSKDKWQSSLCKKASFFGLKYSLRSLDGIACKDKYVAAFAIAMCGGYGDFDGSKCDKNAKVTMKDKTTKEVLLDAVKNDAKKVGKLACMAGGFIPTIGGFVGPACTAIASAA